MPWARAPLPRRPAATELTRSVTTPGEFCRRGRRRRVCACALARQDGQVRTPLAVFDIDGVLADVRHRLWTLESRPKDWDLFFALAPEDPPLAQGLAAVQAEAARGHAIVYLSGRPEQCRADTVAWLARHGFPEAPVHLRPAADRRPARLVKPQLLRALESQHLIVAVYDDDADVIATMRELGYAATHVTWMHSSDADQGTLFEAQEAEGRT